MPVLAPSRRLRDAEADVGEAVGRSELAAIGAARVEAREVPGAAADDAHRGGRRAGRVDDRLDARVVRLRVVAVAAPLPDVARHVEGAAPRHPLRVAADLRGRVERLLAGA